MFTKKTQEENQKHKPNYVAQLDAWIDEQVITALWEVWEMCERVVGEDIEGAEREVVQVKNTVRKAIKEKILESYHNGKEAGQSRQWEKGGKRYGR